MRASSPVVSLTEERRLRRAEAARAYRAGQPRPALRTASARELVAELIREGKRVVTIVRGTAARVLARGIATQAAFATVARASAPGAEFIDWYVSNTTANAIDVQLAPVIDGVEFPLGATALAGNSSARFRSETTCDTVALQVRHQAVASTVTLAVGLRT